MIVTLEEAKQYMRIDYPDDDEVLNDIIKASERLCKAIARIDDGMVFNNSPNAKIAVLYATAYLYEHREEADHTALALSLRSLLTDIRREVF